MTLPRMDAISRVLCRVYSWFVAKYISPGGRYDIIRLMTGRLVQYISKFGSGGTLVFPDSFAVFPCLFLRQ